jgi:hypothetical protein
MLLDFNHGSVAETSPLPLSHLMVLQHRCNGDLLCKSEGVEASPSLLPFMKESGVHVLYSMRATITHVDRGISDGNAYATHSAIWHAKQRTCVSTR